MALIAGRDVEPAEGSDGTDGRWRIARGVAKDRVISVVDPAARHAHKTVHRRQDGFKAHLGVEPETGIVTGCELTKAAGSEAMDGATGVRLLAADDTLCADQPVQVLGDSAYGTGESLAATRAGGGVGAQGDRNAGQDVVRGRRTGGGAHRRSGGIMVGVDGSDTSLRAAAYAAGLARRHQGARVVVAHVANTSSLAGLSPQGAQIMAALHESQTELAEELRARAEAGAASIGVNAQFRTAQGNPFNELVRIAEEIHADAVVLGVSTHTGHRLIGSLAVRMIRTGRWPVTVVP